MKDTKQIKNVVFIVLSIILFVLSCYALKIKGFTVTADDSIIVQVQQVSQNENILGKNTIIEDEENEIEKNVARENIFNDNGTSKNNVIDNNSDENSISKNNIIENNIDISKSVDENKLQNLNNEIKENLSEDIEKTDGEHISENIVVKQNEKISTLSITNPIRLSTAAQKFLHVKYSTQYSYTSGSNNNNPYTYDYTETSTITFLSVVQENVSINGQNYKFEGWNIIGDVNKTLYIAGSTINVSSINNNLFTNIHGQHRTLELTAVWSKETSIQVNYTTFSGNYTNQSELVTAKPTIGSNAETDTQTISQNNSLTLQDISQKLITIKNSDDTYSTYKFNGWKVGTGTNTITKAIGESVSWNDLLNTYSIDNIVNVEPNWELIDSKVKFYIRYDGGIPIYEGSTYTYNQNDYTQVLDTYYIIPNMAMPLADNTSIIQGTATDAQNKAIIINNTIRSLSSETNEHNFYITGFPTDEAIFSKLNSNTNKTGFSSHGIHQDTINSDYYNIRWYVFEYSNNEYRIEGTLVRKENVITVQKIDNLTNNPLQYAGIKFVLKNENETETIKFTHDSNTNIYIYSSTGTIEELTTDNTGTFVIKELPETQKYILKETTALTGYKEETVQGTIEFTNGNSIEIFNLTNTTRMETEGHGTSRYIIAKNNSKTANKLNITKVWDGNVPNEYKKEVELKIYLNGSYIGNYNIDTNGDGVINSDDGTIILNNNVNWTRNYQNIELPLYIDGKKAIYSLRETRIGDLTIDPALGTYNEASGEWTSGNAYKEYIAISQIQQINNKVITLQMYNKVHLIKIDIQKVNYSNESENLPGARFTLQKLADDKESIDSSYAAREFNATDENGLTYLSNLDYNTMYLITETDAPQGFYKKEEPICVMIKENGITLYNKDSNGKYTFEATTTTDTLGNLSSTKDKLIIKNFEHVDLPETGGSGTNIYRLLGATIIILVINFKFIYIKKTKKKGRF